MNTKSGKRIDELLAQNTRQQERISTLEASLSHTNKPKRRQAVDIEDRTDINVVFANREAIRDDAAKVRHKRRKHSEEEKQQLAHAKEAQKMAKQANKLANLIQGI